MKSDVCFATVGWLLKGLFILRKGGNFRLLPNMHLLQSCRISKVGDELLNSQNMGIFLHIFGVMGVYGSNIQTAQ